MAEEMTLAASAPTVRAETQLGAAMVAEMTLVLVPQVRAATGTELALAPGTHSAGSQTVPNSPYRDPMHRLRLAREMASEFPGGATYENMQMALSSIGQSEKRRWAAVKYNQEERHRQEWVKIDAAFMESQLEQQRMEVEMSKELSKTKEAALSQFNALGAAIVAYAIVMVFTFASYHIHELRSDLCPYFEKFSWYNFSRAPVSWSSWTSISAIFSANVGGGCAMNGLLCLAQVLGCLSLHHCLPYKRLRALVGISFFLDTCYRDAGLDSVGKNMGYCMFLFPVTTLVGYALAVQNLKDTQEHYCETSQEKKEARLRFIRETDYMLIAVTVVAVGIIGWFCYQID